jgi:flagellar basal-body rod protein FlgC
VNAIDISTSGLVAQRTRMDTVASNIANVSTTRDAEGRPVPYVRKRVIFEVGGPNQSGTGQGVRVAEIEQDDPDDPNNPGAEPFRLKYEPGHPDGLEAARAYEANIQALEITKAMTNAVTRLLE